jgi:hypothetical protein
MFVCIFIAVVAAMIYAKGYEGGSGASEGVRFGVLLGVMVTFIFRFMSTAEKPKAGLEDTVATSSAICYLDGIAVSSRIAGTTSAIWRGTRRSKKSTTSSGTGGCRRGPSSAISSRS